jgi:phosphate transport system substrate-binding protein
MKDLIKHHVLSVKGEGSEEYIALQQNNLAKEVPLARDLYIINCQGSLVWEWGFHLLLET